MDSRYGIRPLIVVAGLAVMTLVFYWSVGPQKKPVPVVTTRALVKVPAAVKAGPEPVVEPRVTGTQTPTAPRPKGKLPARNPGARVALSMVGTAPVAEAVWVQAINDANLPAQERQDLIEDLNEDGIINRKHPTGPDIELIKARLELIDRLAPGAMDKTNADAFAEARKDLVKMLAKTEP